jgi:hypothetical protein
MELIFSAYLCHYPNIRTKGTYTIMKSLSTDNIPQARNRTPQKSEANALRAELVQLELF